MLFFQRLCLNTSRSQPADRSFTDSQVTETKCESEEVRADRAPQPLAAVSVDSETLPTQLDERLKQEQSAGWQKRTTLNESCPSISHLMPNMSNLNSFCAGAAWDVLMF